MDLGARLGFQKVLQISFDVFHRLRSWKKLGIFRWFLTCWILLDPVTHHVSAIKKQKCCCCFQTCAQHPYPYYPSSYPHMIHHLIHILSILFNSSPAIGRTSWRCRKLCELCGSNAISTMLGRSCRGCSKAWAQPSRAVQRCGCDVGCFLCVEWKKWWKIPSFFVAKCGKAHGNSWISQFFSSQNVGKPMEILESPTFYRLKMWEIPNLQSENSNDMFSVEDLMECDGLGLKHRTWWMIWINFHHDNIIQVLKYVEICRKTCFNRFFNILFSMFWNDHMKQWRHFSVPSNWNPPAETLQLRRSSWNSPPPTARHPDRSSSVGRPRSRPTTLGPSRNEPHRIRMIRIHRSWRKFMEKLIKFGKKNINTWKIVHTCSYFLSTSKSWNRLKYFILFSNSIEVDRSIPTTHSQHILIFTSGNPVTVQSNPVKSQMFLEFSYPI